MKEQEVIDEPNEVEVLIRRLKKVGIEIVLQGNIPWVYLDKVNNNTVQPEDFNDNHGYTIAWYKDEMRLDHDTKEIFRIIRKYR
jgi:hypothetical protein